MAKSATDFGSSFSMRVVESAANTLTFAKIEGGITPMQKVGWVIQKLFFTTDAFSLMNGTGDYAKFALTVSNKLTDLAIDNPGVIFAKHWQRIDMGTAATSIIQDYTFEVDFSTLQGGGLLVLPSPLYLAVQGSGLTAASTGMLRCCFFEIAMADADYFNLVQSRQILINS